VKSWLLIAERALLLSDDIREECGREMALRRSAPWGQHVLMSPDFHLYAGAAATLLGVFARAITQALREQEAQQ
jgi:hypothetical protein